MMDDILQEFLAESWENLGQLDSEIVELEKDPQNAELIASIFRTIHTIKGTCGFLGLTNLGAVAHSAENVLGKMRERMLEVSPGAISLVLEAIDRIKELLQGLEATGEEPKTDHSTLTLMLDELANLATAPVESTQQAASVTPAEKSPAEPQLDQRPLNEQSQTEIAAVPDGNPAAGEEFHPEVVDPLVPATGTEEVASRSSKVSVA
ncbi:MAG TPA: chemotaxis protein CheA, partial [Planctomycetaceae bacterium]|nr:chemotaxis protein CheA [Planctomycetaceae bacterium]